MKKLILFTLVFSICQFSFSQRCPKLDQKNGFRNYIFGVYLNNFPNLRPLKDKNWYYALNEDKKIGDYTVKMISYYFYKSQLAYIIIDVEGQVNSQGVLSVLQKAYGYGHKSNEYIEEYGWLGNVASMIYDENSVTHNATITIQNNALTKQEEAEKQEADKKAAKGL